MLVARIENKRGFVKPVGEESQSQHPPALWEMTFAGRDRLALQVQATGKCEKECCSVPEVALCSSKLVISFSFGVVLAPAPAGSLINS